MLVAFTVARVDSRVGMSSVRSPMSAAAMSRRCSTHTSVMVGPSRSTTYLRHIGLEVEPVWQTALGSDGRPVPDLRAFAYDPGDGRRSATLHLQSSQCVGAGGSAYRVIAFAH
jgi:hypothetical protein